MRSRTPTSQHKLPRSPRTSRRPEAADLLWDVRRAAEQIAEFIGGLDEDAYLADSLRRSAVERQLEIIGEALKKLRQLDPKTGSCICDVVGRG